MGMRKYISSERPNLFEPNVYISMIVKLAGNIEKEDVAGAVGVAYSNNEATMSRIVLEENGDAYYEKMDSSGCKIYVDNRDWQSIIREGEKRTFAVDKGELVRTYIIEKEEEITLLIMAHHLVGDGKSILILVQDIADVLAGKNVEYKPMLLIDTKYLLERAKLPLGVKLAVKRLNKKWKKEGQAFTWEDYYSVHKKYWNNHYSDVKIETFDVKELKENIIRTCQGGITLNSYLITALLQKFPEHKVIGVPVNVREKNNGMSNQTSGIAIKHQFQPSLTFKKNAAEVHKKIYSKLKSATQKYFVLLFISQLSSTLIDSVLLNTHGCYQNKLAQKMAYIMGYAENGGRDFGVTNLGKIDIPSEYRNFKITDILFIPPKISYSKKVVGICTYGDNLHVCFHEMVGEEE